MFNVCNLNHRIYIIDIAHLKFKVTSGHHSFLLNDVAYVKKGVMLMATFKALAVMYYIIALLFNKQKLALVVAIITLVLLS